MKRISGARGLVFLGWLFLMVAASVVLTGSWSNVTAPAIALVGVGLGCLVTAVVLAIEDLNRR
ncbi:hypothetical protein GCM10022419_101760 [Nonomuraea rosea]|uniref:DUF2530 domain-containing protein n=1 Tax=Nonomuraea rosea TaxID=638574 RepID=A0ABP6ZAB3_9ACTN